MNIIAITVSVNYNDYLRLTLEVNHSFFKKWYIVTCTDDLETQNLCKNYSNVEVLFFKFRDSESSFNKGGALQYAQQIAHNANPSDLFLILDSDIALPKNFTQEIQKLDVQEDSVYGAERRMVPSIQDYLNININSDLQQFNYHNWLKPWWQKEPKKYWNVPWGYFQLYKTQNYYTNSKSAQRCDVDFCYCFEQKVLLPLIVDHIGPERINWNGRKSLKENY